MNSSKLLDALQFVLVLDFHTNFDSETCFPRLEQLNQHETGCLSSDRLKVQIDKMENRFQIDIISRNWKTIECIGSLTKDETGTSVFAKIRLTLPHLVVLCVLTALALALLLPLQGSVSVGEKLLALSAWVMWYFILKQRQELRDLIQMTLKE